MFRGIGRNEDGSSLVIVGLTGENLRLLKMGKPIRARYPDGSTVIVLYGETTEDLAEDMRALGWIKPNPSPFPPQ